MVGVRYNEAEILRAIFDCDLPHKAYLGISPFMNYS